MKRVTELKKRLFAIVGGLVFVMVFIVLLFNIHLLRNAQQRIRQNNRRNLQTYMTVMDDAMENIEDMLSAQDIEDVALQKIRRPRQELERYLALLEKKSFFAEEIGKYRFLDGLFLYDDTRDTYIGVRSENVEASCHTAIKKHCEEILLQYETADSPSEWMVTELEGEYYILRMMHWKEIYYCAWIKPENMLADLQQTEADEGGFYILSDRNEKVLNKNVPLQIQKIHDREITVEDVVYEVVSESQTGRGGLTLSYLSRQTSVSDMFEQILIPVVVILVMGVFSLFLVFILTSEMVTNPLSQVFVEEERKKNQAQLQFLQIQTNPHFLNNCLSLIRNLILLDRNKEAEKVALVLGKYTRGYLNSQTEIELKKEMEQVEGYYELQKMRYGERLKLDIYMDDGMEDILVPAMSVLTFVENAVKHQMKKKETLFVLVWVRLKDSGKIFIRVQDNGEGFKKEILAQLKNEEYEESTENSIESREHIGIKNLMQRMSLLYGEEASITFENAETQGAVITMILPERRQGKEDTEKGYLQ